MSFCRGSAPSSERKSAVSPEDLAAWASAVVRQQLPAELEEVTEQQPAHRMGDHVEADRLGRLPLHLLKPGDALQECLEVDGALVEAPAPIVAVLESGCSGGQGSWRIQRSGTTEINRRSVVN